MSCCEDSECYEPVTTEVVSGTTTIPNSSVPLPLPDEQVEELTKDAIDFSLLHGAGMRYRGSYSKTTLSLAPFFLLPTPFPRRDFEKVYELQPLINKLMHKVAHDHDFLEKCLSNTIKVDEFTRNLWDIYTKVRAEGIKQPVSLGLLRSDVMLTQCRPGKCELCLLPPYVMNQQVEINTIASGFGHMGPISAEIQKYVLRRMGRHDLVQKMPENKALRGLCSGMLRAYDLYNSKDSIIMFVVEDVSYNICDQRFHEYELLEMRPEVNVLRRSLTQIANNGKLDAEGRLWVEGQEVAVIYFRAGYDPNCYHGPKEWEARLRIERSLAIKCPSVHYHLSGTKKIQQELASKGALKRFLDEDEVRQVSQLFTGLYTLDMGEEGDASIQRALENPDRYVLKPQREGGGNNIYGDDIKEKLSEIGSTSEREAYILMDRIRAPIQKNYVVRPDNPVELVSTISELGIFGAILGDKDNICYNETCGHMLRSKLSSNNEGGVASGNGALDSVLLVG